MPSTGPRRTLWKEGRHPGVLVVAAASAAVALAIALQLLVGDRLGLLFDVVFVLACAGAALAVRPRDFFTVGVFPPLLLLAVITLLAVVDRSAVARADDALIQAVVSGLAHRAMALLAGYALTLLLLALRQVAIRNAGALRPGLREPAGRQPSTSEL